MIIFKTKVEFKGGCLILGHSNKLTLTEALMDFIPEVKKVSNADGILLYDYLNECVEWLLKEEIIELVNLTITARQVDEAIKAVFDDNNEFVEEVHAAARWYITIEIKRSNNV